MRARTAALIPGANGAIVPAPLLAELLAYGAKVRFVGAPSPCEDRYRPSTALQEFVRTRDLTCRFPGCDRPAVAADIDHTVPWPAGATHPANTKCYCRLHHLVKTFWDGWTDRQNPDATITVTTPTGLSYTTKPFSSLLFPHWNTTTPPPPAQQPAATPARPGRHLMMPTRRRTRAQTRTARIIAERRLNAAERAFFAAASTTPAQTHTADPEPPPTFSVPPATSPTTATTHHRSDLIRGAGFQSQRDDCLAQTILDAPTPWSTLIQGPAGLEQRATTRRHRGVDRANMTPVSGRSPRRDDAQTPGHPRPDPLGTDQTRTPTTPRHRRRTRTTTPCLARRHLRTTTLLTGVWSGMLGT